METLLHVGEALAGLAVLAGCWLAIRPVQRLYAATPRPGLLRTDFGAEVGLFLYLVAALAGGALVVAGLVG